MIGDASHPVDCADFYEYNARTQLTTWIPTPQGATKKEEGPDDYASKHWSGLISGYYVQRAVGFLDQALVDAAAGRALNTTATDLMMATQSYVWQNSFGNPFPLTPVGDAVFVSAALRAKYAAIFAPACGA